MIDPKLETYIPGDTVTKTSYYESKYPFWAVKEAKVLTCKLRKIEDSHLGEVDRAMYRGRYGFQKEYPSFELIINADDGFQYLVSQFGFSKD